MSFEKRPSHLLLMLLWGAYPVTEKHLVQPKVRALTRRPSRAVALLIGAIPILACAQARGAGLKEILGIGESIAKIMLQLHETGSHPWLEEMRHEAPQAC